MQTPERLPSSRPSWIRRAALHGPALAALLAGGALGLAASPAAAQTAGPKFAVIDVRRAVLETEEGLRVQADLKRMFDRTQGELEAKQRQLMADKEVLEKEAQQGRTSKEALQKKYEALLKQDADLQRATADAQRDMQRKEQERTTPILQKIIEAVKRIAAQDGFEIVLEKSAAPYFRADLEITDRAIQQVNMGGGGPKGATPPAGKPAAPAPAAPPAKAPAAPAPKK
jgi:outer membrane protein